MSTAMRVVNFYLLCTLDTGNPDIIGVELSVQGGLICTSTGGSATTVTWRRDGQVLTFDDSAYHQSQRIVSTSSATYETILHITFDSITNYHAMYECLVFNSRGNDSSSIALEGKRLKGVVNF